jgi:hypothetical protein
MSLRFIRGIADSLPNAAVTFDRRSSTSALPLAA